MSDMRLKFALSNGGSASAEVTGDQFNSIAVVLNEGGWVGIPGLLLNARHIVAMETEAIVHV